ncbi:MAG: zf-TFIIB domain-containing protein [Bryobacteraceae bacterium]
MNCEQCGAAMRADRERGCFVCDYCGSEFVPPPEADGVLVLGGTSQLCPVCAKPLSEGSLESHSLKYCTNCRGMSIPMDDLSSLIGALRVRRDRFGGAILPRDAADADRRLHCPACHAEMDAHPYDGGGNVNVDSCEACGLIWLDGGELRRIATAPDPEPKAGIDCGPSYSS